MSAPQAEENDVCLEKLDKKQCEVCESAISDFFQLDVILNINTNKITLNFIPKLPIIKTFIEEFISQDDRQESLIFVNDKVSISSYIANITESLTNFLGEKMSGDVALEQLKQLKKKASKHFSVGQEALKKELHQKNQDFNCLVPYQQDVAAENLKYIKMDDNLTKNKKEGYGRRESTTVVYMNGNKCATVKMSNSLTKVIKTKNKKKPKNETLSMPEKECPQPSKNKHHSKAPQENTIPNLCSQESDLLLQRKIYMEQVLNATRAHKEHKKKREENRSQEGKATSKSHKHRDRKEKKKEKKENASELGQQQCVSEKVKEPNSEEQPLKKKKERNKTEKDTPSHNKHGHSHKHDKPHVVLNNLYISRESSPTNIGKPTETTKGRKLKQVPSTFENNPQVYAVLCEDINIAKIKTPDYQQEPKKRSEHVHKKDKPKKQKESKSASNKKKPKKSKKPILEESEVFDINNLTFVKNKSVQDDGCSQESSNYFKAKLDSCKARIKSLRTKSPPRKELSFTQLNLTPVVGLYRPNSRSNQISHHSLCRGDLSPIPEYRGQERPERLKKKSHRHKSNEKKSSISELITKKEKTKGNKNVYGFKSFLDNINKKRNHHSRKKVVSTDRLIEISTKAIDEDGTTRIGFTVEGIEPPKRLIIKDISEKSEEAKALLENKLKRLHMTYFPIIQITGEDSVKDDNEKIIQESSSSKEHSHMADTTSSTPTEQSECTEFVGKSLKEEIFRFKEDPKECQTDDKSSIMEESEMFFRDQRDSYSIKKSEDESAYETEVKTIGRIKFHNSILNLREPQTEKSTENTNASTKYKDSLETMSSKCQKPNITYKVPKKNVCKTKDTKLKVDVLYDGKHKYSKDLEKSEEKIENDSLVTTPGQVSRVDVSQKKRTVSRIPRLKLEKNDNFDSDGKRIARSFRGQTNRVFTAVVHTGPDYVVKNELSKVVEHKQQKNKGFEKPHLEEEIRNQSGDFIPRQSRNISVKNKKEEPLATEKRPTKQENKMECFPKSNAQPIYFGSCATKHSPRTKYFLKRFLESLGEDEGVKASKLEVSINNILKKEYSESQIERLSYIEENRNIIITKLKARKSLKKVNSNTSTTKDSFRKERLPRTSSSADDIFRKFQSRSKLSVLGSESKISSARSSCSNYMIGREYYRSYAGAQYRKGGYVVRKVRAINDGQAELISLQVPQTQRDGDKKGIGKRKQEAKTADLYGYNEPGVSSYRGLVCHLCKKLICCCQKEKLTGDEDENYKNKEKEPKPQPYTGPTIIRGVKQPKKPSQPPPSKAEPQMDAANKPYPTTFMPALLQPMYRQELFPNCPDNNVFHTFVLLMDNQFPTTSNKMAVEKESSTSELPRSSSLTTVSKISYKVKKKFKTDSSSCVSDNRYCKRKKGKVKKKTSSQKKVTNKPISHEMPSSSCSSEICTGACQKIKEKTSFQDNQNTCENNCQKPCCCDVACQSSEIESPNTSFIQTILPTYKQESSTAIRNVFERSREASPMQAEVDQTAPFYLHKKPKMLENLGISNTNSLCSTQKSKVEPEAFSADSLDSIERKKGFHGDAGADITRKMTSFRCLGESKTTTFLVYNSRIEDNSPYKKGREEKEKGVCPKTTCGRTNSLASEESGYESTLSKNKVKGAVKKNGGLLELFRKNRKVKKEKESMSASNSKSCDLNCTWESLAALKQIETLNQLKSLHQFSSFQQVNRSLESKMPQTANEEQPQNVTSVQALNFIPPLNILQHQMTNLQQLNNLSQLSNNVQEIKMKTEEYIPKEKRSTQKSSLVEITSTASNILGSPEQHSPFIDPQFILASFNALLNNCPNVFEPTQQCKSGDCCNESCKDAEKMVSEDVERKPSATSRACKFFINLAAKKFGSKDEKQNALIGEDKSKQNASKKFVAKNEGQNFTVCGENSKNACPKRQDMRDDSNALYEDSNNETYDEQEACVCLPKKPKDGQNNRMDQLEDDIDDPDGNITYGEYRNNPAKNRVTQEKNRRFRADPDFCLLETHNRHANENYSRIAHPPRLFDNRSPRRSPMRKKTASEEEFGCEDSEADRSQNDYADQGISRGGRTNKIARQYKQDSRADDCNCIVPVAKGALFNEKQDQRILRDKNIERNTLKINEMYNAQNNQMYNQQNDQMYKPQNNQIYNPQNNQLYNPQDNQMYKLQIDQTYKQQNNQIYNPQNDQMYKQPNNQIYNPQNDQMYKPPNNQRFNPPPNDQMYQPPNNQVYNPQNDQMYKPQSDQLYTPQNNQTYNQQNNQIYNPQNNQIYNPQNNEIYKADYKDFYDNLAIQKRNSVSPNRSIPRSRRPYSDDEDFIQHKDERRDTPYPNGPQGRGHSSKEEFYNEFEDQRIKNGSHNQQERQRFEFNGKNTNQENNSKKSSLEKRPRKSGRMNQFFQSVRRTARQNDESDFVDECPYDNENDCPGRQCPKYCRGDLSRTHDYYDEPSGKRRLCQRKRSQRLNKKYSAACQDCIDDEQDFSKPPNEHLKLGGKKRKNFSDSQNYPENFKPPPDKPRIAEENVPLGKYYQSSEQPLIEFQTLKIQEEKVPLQGGKKPTAQSDGSKVVICKDEYCETSKHKGKGTRKKKSQGKIRSLFFRKSKKTESEELKGHENSSSSSTSSETKETFFQESMAKDTSSDESRSKKEKKRKKRRKRSDVSFNDELSKKDRTLKSSDSDWDSGSIDNKDNEGLNYSDSESDPERINKKGKEIRLYSASGRDPYKKEMEHRKYSDSGWDPERPGKKRKAKKKSSDSCWNSKRMGKKGKKHLKTSDGDLDPNRKRKKEKNKKKVARRPSVTFDELYTNDTFGEDGSASEMKNKDISDNSSSSNEDYAARRYNEIRDRDFVGSIGFGGKTEYYRRKRGKVVNKKGGFSPRSSKHKAKLNRSSDFSRPIGGRVSKRNVDNQSSSILFKPKSKLSKQTIGSKYSKPKLSRHSFRLFCDCNEIPPFWKKQTQECKAYYDKIRIEQEARKQGYYRQYTEFKEIPLEVLMGRAYRPQKQPPIAVEVQTEPKKVPKVVIEVPPVAEISKSINLDDLCDLLPMEALPLRLAQGAKYEEEEEEEKEADEKAEEMEEEDVLEEEDEELKYDRIRDELKADTEFMVGEILERVFARSDGPKNQETSSLENVIIEDKFKTFEEAKMNMSDKEVFDIILNTYEKEDNIAEKLSNDSYFFADQLGTVRSKDSVETIVKAMPRDPAMAMFDESDNKLITPKEGLYEVVDPAEIGQCFTRGFRPDNIALSGEACFVSNKQDKIKASRIAEKESIIDFSERDTPLDFLLGLGFMVDEATNALKDEDVEHRLLAAITEARVWINQITTTQGTLLYLVALKAKPKTMRYFLQLVEAIINKRINNAVKLDGFLRALEKIEDGEIGMINIFGLTQFEDEDNEEKVVKNQLREVFISVYKVAEREANARGHSLPVEAILLLRILAARYRAGLHPHLELIASYIGKGLLVTDVQLEAAMIFLSRLDTVDVRITEFEKYCGIRGS